MNTPIKHQTAPGAVQLSPSPMIPVAPEIAGQGVNAQPESGRISAIPSGGAGVSRRSIMNMIVSTAIAGTAIPAVAASNPDAEVIAAGQKVEALLDGLIPSFLTWARQFREAKDETVAIFGRDYGSAAWKGNNGPAQAHLDAALIRTGAAAANDAIDAYSGDIYPLADLIRDAETTTLEGLRAKVLVSIFDCRPCMARHGGNFDFSEGDSYWSLFDAAAAVTGLSGLIRKYENLMEQDAATIVEEKAPEAPDVVPVEVIDPIFAAIEVHRLACDRHTAILGEDELEAAIPEERRQSSYYDALNEKPDWRVETDDPRWIAHIEEGVSAWDAEQEAAVALLDTDRLTPAGALALLEHANSMEAKCGDMWPDVVDDDEKLCSWRSLMMRQVAEALRPAVQRAA